jgi:5-oxoprolinase (ATP-hydrolysing)
VPVFRRADLALGDTLEGPAIVAEDNATTVVETGWRARLDALGNLVLTRAVRRARRESVARARDPIMLEIFNNQFMHVAEQMGVVLEQTAHSVNIKERLDYSCALFDADGELIANAPHVPVHLGSMGDSVRAVLDAGARTNGHGRVYMLNAPYRGGTHLPDITVVTPVFLHDGALDFVVASRAHHADIGGLTPGSMPALSRHIDEEGVLFEPFEIVSGGVFHAAAIRERLANGPYPARAPEQNLADLRAQVAANAKGAAELVALVARFSAGVVRAYMTHIKDNAEECVRRAVARLDDGAWELELDGGERIRVTITIDRQRGEAHIDFTGTSPMSPGNYNAPAAIARAVVLYVFRTLVAEDIPLNAGCMKPLRLTLPAGSLVDPAYPAAVVAGNVETSQCIADALLAALGAAAASQGTMNNLTFGNAVHQYYETLCGGTGAGPGFHGASAVHSHMTNSRLTDVEVLEQRYPVRVRRFAIRTGSGGHGRFSGGNGIVRELEFLEPMTGSLLANRRRTVPFGLAGGGDGAPGRNRIIRADGAVEELGAQAALTFGAGDRFVIETPGGGGYGGSVGP